MFVKLSRLEEGKKKKKGEFENLQTREFPLLILVVSKKKQGRNGNGKKRKKRESEKERNQVKPNFSICHHNHYIITPLIQVTFVAYTQVSPYSL